MEVTKIFDSMHTECLINDIIVSVLNGYIL